MKETSKDDTTGTILLGVLMLILGAIVIICVWCKRKSLETAIAVIDASADFLIDTKRVILVSVMYFIIAIIATLIWCVSVYAMGSINDIIVVADPLSDNGYKKELVKHAAWDGLAGFEVVGLLWILMLIDHTNKYICMVSAATYYFDSNP